MAFLEVSATLDVSDLGDAPACSWRLAETLGLRRYAVRRLELSSDAEVVVDLGAPGVHAVGVSARGGFATVGFTTSAQPAPQRLSVDPGALYLSRAHPVTGLTVAGEAGRLVTLDLFLGELV